jgi:hypothetical protein
VSSPYLKHAPKHRAPKARRAPKLALKASLTLSSMAVVATGVAVAGGSLALSPGDDGATADRSTTSTAAELTSAAPTPADTATGATAAPEKDAADQDAQAEAPAAAAAEGARLPVVTRSDNRSEVADPAKVDVLSLGSGNAVARTEDMTDEDPRTIAQALLTEFGFDQDQFGCLDSLWTRESGWNVSADNPTSSAYGIPQALPGSKMSSAGADWATNPVTQIRWGLGYIQDRYGSPCGAWAMSESQGFY